MTHKGRVLFDATACPQDIAYPTDLELLSAAREKSQELIDVISLAAISNSVIQNPVLRHNLLKRNQFWWGYQQQTNFRLSLLKTIRPMVYPKVHEPNKYQRRL